jgi:alpha-L-fucosidase
MKNILVVPIAAAVLALCGFHRPAQAQGSPAVTSISAEERIQWFRHDKFGMFIHWGPYSALAGEWRGKHVPIGTEAEWIMQRFNIPVKDYRERARQLNPVNFNAEVWVDLAKATGMKYLVITAKHHDGFAMYHSQVSPYNIVDWTSFKRDPLKELSEACRKAGIRFCVYYSHREDWDDPDGFGNTWDYDNSKKNFQRYLDQKSKPQLKELLTNYGPLGLVWFDRGMDTPAHAAEFVNLVRSLQPKCLINGRVGNYGQELMGDYQDMKDNGMPAGGLEEDWETPQTLNTTWGYSKFDQQWKTPAVVIHRLVEIVSKGGNYLLNIGPTADGTVPPASIATLRQVGDWMRRNGESIYGTSASPLPEYPWGKTTVKGQKVYLHVFSWPADAKLRLAGLKNQARNAYLLTDPSRKLPIGIDNGTISISLPHRTSDENDTVVVLELVGAPKVNLPVVTQDSDNGFELDYLTALTTGNAKKSFNRDGRFHISRWSAPGDTVTWHLLVSRAGRYKLGIRYAARQEWGDARYVVTIGARSFTESVVPTGDGYQYGALDLGATDFQRAGEYTVQIRPAAEYSHNLMYFQSMQLQPIE